MPEEQQDTTIRDVEQKAYNEHEPATDAEMVQLHAVLVAAQEYITAVKEQQKGGVGRAWAQLVKAVHACEEESIDVEIKV